MKLTRQEKKFYKSVLSRKELRALLHPEKYPEKFQISMNKMTAFERKLKTKMDNWKLKAIDLDVNSFCESCGVFLSKNVVEEKLKNDVVLVELDGEYRTDLDGSEKYSFFARDYITCPICGKNVFSRKRYWMNVVEHSILMPSFSGLLRSQVSEEEYEEYAKKVVLSERVRPRDEK